MKNRMSARSLAAAGLLAAVSIALSLAESWLPPLPLPGVRLGLANVAVTAAVWWLGPFVGGCVAVLKVLFVLVTRGVTAGLMSACGTTLAVAAMVCLLPLVRREKLTFVGVNVTAAALHSMGQLLCASCWLSASVYTFAPPMLFVSLACGVITGWILNVTVPRISFERNSRKDG